MVAEDLLAQFLDFYAAGDLPSLMALFAPDARNNRGAGHEAIRTDYAAFFDRYRSRSLTLTNMNWSDDDGRLIGNGRFLAKIQSGRYAGLVRGDILIVLVLVEGRPRIRELRHDNDVF
jgi:hypothetical protein